MRRKLWVTGLAHAGQVLQLGKHADLADTLKDRFCPKAQQTFLDLSPGLSAVVNKLGLSYFLAKENLQPTLFMVTATLQVKQCSARLPKTAPPAASN